MDIPHRGSRPTLAPPDIFVQRDSNPHDRFRTSSSSSSYNSNSSGATSSIPMSIPNAREAVPPPLPPPKHIPDIADGGSHGRDIAWQWGNPHEDQDCGRAPVPSGSSLYGSFASRKSVMDSRPDFDRRGSSTSTIKSISGDDGREAMYPKVDEGYASLSWTSLGSNQSVLHTYHQVKLVPTS